MSRIIRGTTPTLKYVFKSVKVSDIVSAYLTIKANTSIEKTLSDAVVGTDYISWTLTQAETLAFGNEVSVMLNWKLQNGTRGASEQKTIIIDDNLKDSVI